MTSGTRIWFAIFSLSLMTLFAPRVEAAELGLTPSHVVGLWTNVNSALVVYAKSTGAVDKASAMEGLSANSFSGKKPSDVLGEVVRFRERINQLKLSGNLKETKVYGRGDGQINPSIVFMNSGFVLDSVVELVIARSERDVMISPLFKQHEISGKKPSDAFAMVDLAHRRLDILVR